MTPRWARRKRLDELRVARGMVRATLNPIIGHVGSTGRSKGNHEHWRVSADRMHILPDPTRAYVGSVGARLRPDGAVFPSNRLGAWQEQPRKDHP